MAGNQQPLYRSVPDGAVRSWGQGAIDLATSIDLRLDAGQEDILIDGMSQRAGGLWLAREVADVEPRQNGKSLLFEVRALTGAYVLKEPLIIWTAHEFKTAMRSFESLRDKVTNWDFLRKRVKAIRNSGATTEIELMNPMRKIVFLARSGGSGRGFAQVSPLLLDEAFALQPHQMGALQYAMSAARDPQVWYGSSAPLTTSEVLRDLVRDGRRGGKRTVYYEWSVPGKYRELERIAERNKARIKRGEPGDEDFIRLTLQANRSVGRPGGVGVSIEAAEEELKRATDVEVFLRERWGVFSEAEEGGRINPEVWKDLADPDSRREGECSLGVDISMDRSYVSIVLYALRADGQEHVQLIRFLHGTYEVVDALVELREILNPVAIGMAAGTYAALKVRLKQENFLRPQERPIDSAAMQLEGKDPHPPQRGDLLVMNGTDMAAACGALLESVKAGTLRHVPADQLDGAVAVGQTKKSGDVMAWVRDDESIDITALVAATEAKFTHEARVNEIEDYDPAGDIW